MSYDRVSLKNGAKLRLKQDGVPSYKMVTLVYLLLASLLPSVLDAFVSTPNLSLTYEISEAYLNMNVDLVIDLVAQYVTSTGGMVAMGLSILMGLFTVVMTVGYQFYMLNVSRNRAAGYDDLSYGLNFVGKVILLTILQFIYILLWSCLFVIPGIIAAYRYRLSYYALIDDPSITPGEAIRRSKLLMKGRKMDLFVLSLSFLGWMILASVCSSVGEAIGGVFGSSTVFGALMTVILAFAAYLPLGLWVTAYKQLAEVYFYECACGSVAQSQNPGGFSDRPYDYRQTGDDWQNQPPQNDNDGNNDNNRWNQPDNDPWN